LHIHSTLVIVYGKNQGLETVLRTGSGTLKNTRFCSVLGTGSRPNPKFEKKVPELIPGNPK
jgi:hypothetical protein